MTRFFLLSLALLGASCNRCNQAPTSSSSSSTRTRTPTVRVRIDLDGERREISPYIYGVNGHELAEGRGHEMPFRRLGGNRTSTYNWENNASNAGSDYHHISDSYFGEREDPAAYVLTFIESARADAALPLVTVPLLPFVARDREGPVAEDASITSRFVASHARTPAPRTTDINALDVNDDEVFQDAFVRFVEERADEPVAYSLGNEPGGWAATHSRIQRTPLTYEEHLRRSVEYAAAVRFSREFGLRSKRRGLR